MISRAITMDRIAMAFAVALVATALGLGASITIGSGYDPRMGYGLDYGRGNLSQAPTRGDLLSIHEI